MRRDALATPPAALLPPTGACTPRPPLSLKPAGFDWTDPGPAHSCAAQDCFVGVRDEYLPLVGPLIDELLDKFFHQGGRRHAQQWQSWLDAASAARTARRRCGRSSKCCRRVSAHSPPTDASTMPARHLSPSAYSIGDCANFVSRE